MYSKPTTHIVINRLVFSVLLMLCAVTSMAQETPPEQGQILFDKFYNKPKSASGLRSIISRISLGVSTGYGRTFYKHDLQNLVLLQKADSGTFLFGTNELVTPGSPDIGVAYTNWFNTVTSTDTVVVDYAENDYLVSSDTTDLGYKARARGIPLTFTLHYAFDRYRIGLGASFEFHKINTFKPTNLGDTIPSFASPVSNATFKRYFLMLGGRVYSYYDYSLVVDAQLGIMKQGKNFDTSVITKGIFFNMGASFERDFSEYFTVFVRPSYEIKSFKTNIPDGPTVSHKYPSFFLNVGVHLRLPELPKCKIKNCQIQMNHTHGGGKNWRSRMHPFWKKQNPKYGENYPKPLKELRKNKKKLSPF